MHAILHLGSEEIAGMAPSHNKQTSAPRFSYSSSSNKRALKPLLVPSWPPSSFQI